MEKNWSIKPKVENFNFQFEAKVAQLLRHCVKI